MKSLFELGYVIEAIDRASGVIERVEGHVKHLDGAVGKSGGVWSRTFSQVNATLENVGKHLTHVGAGMAGFGAAGLYGMHELANEAIRSDGAMAHVVTTMDRMEDQLKHVHEIEQAMGKIELASIFDDAMLSLGYYTARSKSGFADFEKAHQYALSAVPAAVAVVQATAENADDALNKLRPTLTLLAQLTHNLGGETMQWADMITLLQTQYAFENIGEVLEATRGRAAALTKTLKIDPREMLATVAALQLAGLPAGEAATAYAATVAKISSGKHLHEFAKVTKSGALSIANSIDALDRATRKLGPVAKQVFLREHGFGKQDVTGVSLLLDQAGWIRDVTQKIDAQRGIAVEKSNQRMAAADFQLTKLTRHGEALSQVLGRPLVESGKKWMPDVLHQIEHVIDFFEAHPALTKTLVQSSALTLGTLVPLGTAAGAVGMLARVLAMPATSVLLYGGAAAALTALSAAMVTNYDTTETLGENWQDLIDKVGGFVDAHAAAEKIAQMSLPPPMMAPLHPTLGQVIVTSDFTTSLVDAFTIDSGIYRHMGYEMATDFVHGIWDYLKSLDQSVGQMMVDAAMGVARTNWDEKIWAAAGLAADVAIGSGKQLRRAAQQTTLVDIYGPKLAPVLPLAFPVTPVAPAAARGGDRFHLIYAPKITVNGAADENQLQSMLDDHADDLMSKMETAQRRARFAEY